MESESLDQLKSAFGNWRKSKQSRGESIPPELLERARAATIKFGVNAVRRTLNIDRRLIEQQPLRRGRGRPRRIKEEPARRGSGRPRHVAAVPSYSRLELSASAVVPPQPIAEFETAGGSKLRVFVMSPETVSLLTSLCSGGGAR